MNQVVTAEKLVGILSRGVVEDDAFLITLEDRATIASIVRQMYAATAASIQDARRPSAGFVISDKPCPKCKRVDMEFALRKSGHRVSYCRECAAVYARQYNER